MAICKLFCLHTVFQSHENESSQNDEQLRAKSFWSNPALNHSPAVSCLQWWCLVHFSRRSATGAPVTPSSVTWWWVGLLSYQPPPPAAWMGPRTTASSDTWRLASSQCSESLVPNFDLEVQLWYYLGSLLSGCFYLSTVIKYFLNRIDKNVD